MAEATNIGSAVGSTLQSLPIDTMIAGPLLAAVAAQIRASHAYKEFVETVGLEDGKPVMIPFEYVEDVLNSEGAVVDQRVRKFSVPLLALVSHPNVNIDTVAIEFDLTIENLEQSTSSTQGEAGIEGSAGWGPFSVKIHGKVSHKSEQTRKTDTRAKYSIKVSASRSGPPEGMMRVLDALVDEAARPRIPSGSTPSINQG